MNAPRLAGALAGLACLSAAVPAPNARVRLSGDWQVGPIVDPTGQPLPADLAAQLASARLPSPGEKVRAKAGKLCVGSAPCDTVSWTQTAYARSEYGKGLMLSFALSPQTRVYRGDTGNRFIGYTLFGQRDGNLLALVSVCQDANRARGCRATYEVWRPLGSDARFVPVAHRR